MDKNQKIIEKINENAVFHRSLPFWSWNDKLVGEKLAGQISSMNDAKIGGFFMHARGGLVTEYMGEEWFDVTDECIKVAKELNMEAWAYDEAGWPSGFAAGKVPKLGVDYQQKWLELKLVGELKGNEWVLGFYKCENNELVYSKEKYGMEYAVIVGINKYYIDAINEKSIEKFIEFTHEEYYRRYKDDFGDGLKGFFTDEPQYGWTFTPWSQVIETNFVQKYGYSTVGRLALLFIDAYGYEKFRNDYHSLVNSLFTDGFMKKMYDWCNEHNCQLTGHMMSEDDLITQMSCTGGVMPSYEYFHIPGIDWLGRKIESPIVPKQLGSAAAQLGKDRTLTESFALCGWDVSLDELKWIASWQYVNGVNLTCQHLEGYTLRGFRKRDYPPSLFIQQPWFDEYYNFNEYFTKLGSALSLGEDTPKVLMLHPMHSAYVVVNEYKQDDIIKLNKDFISATSKLAALQIEHHYGDETLMRKFGCVESNTLKIGKCSYNKVVMPSLINISSETLNILQEYVSDGGELYHMGTLPTLVEGEKCERLAEICSKSIELCCDDNIISNLKNKYTLSIKENGNICNTIHVMSKILDEGNLYFVANLDKQNGYKADVIIEGDIEVSVVDLLDESITKLKTNYENGKTTLCLPFENMGTYLLLTKSQVDERKACCCDKKLVEKIILDRTFNIDYQSDNAMTLDKCEYSIDGGPWQGKRAIILLQIELLAMKKSCDIQMKFNFNIDETAQISRLKLAIECPTEFDIAINGENFAGSVDGYYVDSAFETIDIIDYVVKGKNEIILSRKFFQSDNVYHVLFDEDVHESETNKLTYDVELESVYLIGDFGVSNTGGVRYGEKKAVYAQDDFMLVKASNVVDATKITESDFWFFRGEMKLSQSINIKKDSTKTYEVEFSKLNAPIAKMFVNGKEAKLLMFAPFKADITDLLIDGENMLTLQIFSSNRNLLGPHHYGNGESYDVGPDTFTDNAGWSDDSETFEWNDGYCFVKFGVEF